MTRWTWTHLNSAIKVQSGQTGPPEVSRSRKPIQRALNPGTAHRGASDQHCTWINRTQLIMWVWTSGTAVSPCSRAHATAHGHTVAPAAGAPQRPCILQGDGWQPGIHTLFLLSVFSSSPGPLFVGVFSFFLSLSLPTLHKRLAAREQAHGCVRGFDACKCALADAESAF